MAVTVKKVSIWRTEVEDRPGTLARVLEPLAGAGADLKVVMGYRYPGEGSRAAIEVYPVSGKKLTAAAQSAGLSPVSIPTLQVEGDDRPGLGQKLSAALGEGGINISYVVAQVVQEVLGRLRLPGRHRRGQGLGADQEGCHTAAEASQEEEAGQEEEEVSAGGSPGRGAGLAPNVAHDLDAPAQAPLEFFRTLLAPPGP